LSVSLLDKNGKIKTTDAVVKEVLRNRTIKLQQQEDDPFSFLKSFPETSSYSGNENTLAIPNFLIRGSNGKRKPYLWQYLTDKVPWIAIGANKIGNTGVNSGVAVLNAKQGEPVERKSDDLPVVKKIKKLINDPNPKQKFPEIYKQLLSDLSTAGKAYVIIIYLEDEPPFLNPIAIYRADYRCMRPVYLHDYLAHKGVNQSEIDKWKNRIVVWCQETIIGLESFEEPKGKQTTDKASWLIGNGTNTTYFYPEQIIEIKLNASGTSPLESLEDDIATEIAARKYTYAYFRNATKTGMVLTLENGTPADAKQNKEWLNTEYATPAGAWKPLFLLGGVKMVTAGANVSDVQYLEIRQFSKSVCCAVMEIPESFFSGGGGNEEDSINFENDTVKPKEILILSSLQKKFEEIWPSEKDRFVIQPAIIGRASYHLMKISQLVAMTGGTINELRALRKAPRLEGENYDIPLLASNIMPIDFLEKTINLKQLGPTVVRDNDPAQRRGENIQGGRSGVFNEQR